MKLKTFSWTAALQIFLCFARSSRVRFNSITAHTAIYPSCAIALAEPKSSPTCLHLHASRSTALRRRPACLIFLKSSHKPRPSVSWRVSGWDHTFFEIPDGTRWCGIRFAGPRMAQAAQITDFGEDSGPGARRPLVLYFNGLRASATNYLPVVSRRFVAPRYGSAEV